jgi:AraC family transcriptional regulator
MSALELEDRKVEALPRAVPAVVSLLIDNAVAVLDADLGTARSYLMRASAILQACIAREDDAAAPERHAGGGLARWQLNRIIDYVEQHLTERINGQELACLIGVSIGQLFRAFKASVGVPPMHFVTARRFDFACLLLRTSDQPLSQVALTAGFCDQSHLCRVFRRLTGMTPAAWRRIHADDPEIIPTICTGVLRPGEFKENGASPAPAAGTDKFTAAENKPRVC